MYWDSTATTPVKLEVLDAMLPYFTDKWYNPSSIYEPARDVRRDVEKARKTIADSINADPDEIYFTSGGSEANNWAIMCCGWHPPIISTIEHHSLMKAADYYKPIEVDTYGKIVLTDFEQSIHTTPKTEPVSVQMVNNEIGTIQNIKELVKIAHEKRLIFHTDAVQAYGKIPIDVKDLGVDLLSASGHKIGAPKGIGFLYVKKGIKIQPWIEGSQERGLRGGTENVPYIMGFAKAVELIDYNEQNKYKEFYDYAVGNCHDFAKVNGHPSDRVYNILSLTVKEKIDGKQLIGLLHDVKQYVSAGSACNSYSNEPSHVLKAIGLTDNEATRTIRISFFEGVTKADIDKLFDDIRGLIQALRMLGEK